MSEVLDPSAIFDMIASQVPADLHEHLLIVGSLAAAYHHRTTLKQRGVNTKDADLIVRPAGAIEECRRIAERLLSEGWSKHKNCWASPHGTPLSELRAIRLIPPDRAPYFIELLAIPSPDQRELKIWIPCELSDGLYGLPSFRFMSVTNLEAQRASTGLYYAHPAMMVLSNLLSHPTIGAEKMSEPIGDRILHRASKDLGRVLALARLAGREETEGWVELWERALRENFPDEAPSLSASLGNGLRELLSDNGLLEEARHAVEIGLLNGFGVTVQNLSAIGQQLLGDTIEPVEKTFNAGAP